LEKFKAFEEKKNSWKVTQDMLRVGTQIHRNNAEVPDRSKE
jgi:hypothetical protein